jgi:crotonobetainyl-CoA:carnitine CoA-transferase CaiB-like acyl-CoA transferase
VALNANKRRVSADPAELSRLVARADAVIQTEARLTYEELAAVNRRLVLVTITPYGCAGPLAGASGSDLEVTAASGSLWLAGEPGRMPVRTTLPQSPFWTGMYAAMGALVALAAREVTGRGQHVDVSAQACMATVHPPAIIFWDTLREEHGRLGPFLIGRSIVGARFRNIWPCRDGFVSFAIQGGPIGRHTGRMLAEWMREKDASDDVITAVDWDRFDNRTLSQVEVDRLEASVAKFLSTLTKREFFAGVIARNMLGYPVADVRDIFADEQLRARDFWQSIRIGERELPFPGGFALFDGERPRLRRGVPERAEGQPEETEVWNDRRMGEFSAQSAERMGASTAQPDATASGERTGGPAAQRDALPPKQSSPEWTQGHREPAGGPGREAHPGSLDAQTSLGALQGIRVVELGWAAAGPLVGKYLANHGAEVIHLESATALDAFRSTYPPFRGEPSPDAAAMFAFYNDGKKGATLNLRHPKAAGLALRLVAKSDVVIESFPAGTLARRGLSHEALRSARSDIVVLSSCNQGQTGPHAQHPGYGSQLTALAGFNELLGERGRTPVILYGPYIDYIAVGYGVIAILAALERRRRTGAGCVIDLSQYEAGLQFMAPALLEHAANGSVLSRDGNRDPVARPHGVYRCAGEDRWVALSVWSDAEWERLRRAAGHGEWRRDDPELDARLERWTCERSREEIVAALRSEGLRVAPVETIAELAEDPQLAHRGFWRATAHPVLGSVTAMAPPFVLSETPAILERAGPTLAEHNDQVWRGLLGLENSEYRALAAEGVFD